MFVANHFTSDPHRNHTQSVRNRDPAPGRTTGQSRDARFLLPPQSATPVRKI